MSRRALWIALLDAAQDQPRPTKALRWAVEELLRRDPVVLDAPEAEVPGVDAIDQRMVALAAARKRPRRPTPTQQRRASRAERFLTGLAEIQAEDDS